MYLLPLSSSEKCVHTCQTCLEQCYIAVLVLNCEEFIFISVCLLLLHINDPSPWPFHLQLWSRLSPAQVSVLNAHTCTPACTHCLAAASVVVGHYVPLFKILARPHSWIMLLRNRSVWKCSTALSCRPVDTKVKSREELWLHRKHEEYYLDAVQYLRLLVA